VPFLTNLRATLLTGVLVILSVLGGCQKSAADHLALARSSIAAKDSTSAILHLKNALAQDAENAEARYLLGLQELAVGDAVAAVIDLKRARELKAEEEQVVPELAEAMVAAGQARFLIEQLGEVKLQNQAGVVRLATALAQAQLSVGNLPQAKVAIARALAADPLAQTALLTQARITLAEGDAAGALAQTMALITKAPRYADVWAYKGELHDLALGQQTQALAAYGKALEINPSHVPSLAGILSIQLTRKELDNSRATLAKLAKAAPRSFLAQYFEARLNHLEGKYVVARTQFQILQNAAPDNVAVLMAAGLNELALGSTIQAEALLSKAAALAPANPAARYLSAFVNLRIGRPEQATVALQPLLSSKDVAAEVLVLAAQARLLQGDPSGADNLFTQAEAMHSTEPSVRTALAVARASRGNGDAALRELESLAMSTDGIEADLKLISSRLARGELELAQAAIEALEKKQPDKPASFELRGQLMLKQGNPDGARKAFEMALQKDKHFLSAVTQLTNLDIAQSRFDQARARLKNFQVLDPGNAAVLVAMAGLEVRAGGSSTDVINLLTKATKANPRDVGAWKTLVTRHLISGNAPGRDLNGSGGGGRCA
jgi:putative PEP-CTERM system TPR-repeat lipoprotein